VSDDDPPDQLCSVESGADNRLNDGRVDARGRLWIGTMDNQLHRPNGALYRVEADGRTTHMFGDVIVTNGIAFSPDNRTLYFTDTRRYRTWQFDFDLDDGAISNRRLFADYSASGERPDGACIDVAGGLWTAFFSGGRVVRYRPDGRIDTVIAVPATNPTCVCFGGADLKTLFVTTARKFLDREQLSREPEAGHVLAIDGIAQGLPEHRFGNSS
jgi:sugar lactone lactonase YvrE